MDYLNTLQFKNNLLVDATGYPQNERFLLKSTTQNEASASSVFLGVNNVKVNIVDGIGSNPATIQSVTDGGGNSNLSIKAEGSGSVKLAAHRLNYLTVTGSDADGDQVILSGDSPNNADVNVVLLPKSVGDVVAFSDAKPRIEGSRNILISRVASGSANMILKTSASNGKVVVSSDFPDQLQFYTGNGTSQINIASGTNTNSSLLITPQNNGSVTSTKRLQISGSTTSASSVDTSQMSVKNLTSGATCSAAVRANNAPASFSLDRASVIGRCISLDQYGNFEIRNNVRYESGAAIFRIEPSGRFVSNKTYQSGIYSGGSASGTITFTTPFDSTPIVHASVDNINSANVFMPRVYNITGNGFSFSKVYNNAASPGAWTGAASETMWWIAIALT
jgi:hypothetical protein